MITIQHGPLPSDGQTVDPSVFLEAWLSQSVITGLGATSFGTGADNELNFFFSQTDAPASSAVFPGALWFKRGEGKMYIWDQLGQPSSFTSAWETNQGRWISLSDRREMLGIAHEDILPGDIVHFNVSPEGDVLIMGESGSAGPPNEWLDVNTGANGPNHLIGSGFHVRQFAWKFTNAPILQDNTASVVEVFGVAAETGASGFPFRVVEWGFCSLAAGSGVTGAAGPVFISSSGVTFCAWGQVGTYTQSTNPARQWVGHFTDSSATNAEGRWVRAGWTPHQSPFGIARAR